MVPILFVLMLATPPSGTGADSLPRRSADPVSWSDPESRARALRALEEACRLAPRRADLWLAFGRACARAGHHERAKACFERAARAAPAAAEAWTSLGDAWKDEWLRRVDRAALDQARASYEQATVLAPEDAEPWASLAACALLRGDPRAGLRAALRANETDPRAPQPMWMLGASLFRLGSLAYADSAFREARRHLPDSLAARVERAGFVWAGHDPDLTTPENEAELDYLARFALALFLFSDQGAMHWDMRAELFVRYGPPSGIEFGPAWAQLGWEQELEFHYAPDAQRPLYAPGPIGFPYDMQVWHYPELGMDVTLWDRFLTSTYDLPYSKQREQDPRPDPATLAGRDDLVPFGDGRGVYRAMAPGLKRLPLEAECDRFPSGADARVVGSIRATGNSSDSLWGSWAVADSTGHVVATATARLDASTCEPARDRAGTFTTNVAPGRYRVDFAAWDGRGKRGVEHRALVVEAPPIGPTLSDLLLLCADVRAGSSPDPRRLEPAIGGRVSGGQLTLYCEIDRLLSDPARPARFRYRTAMYALDRSGKRRTNAGPVYDAVREESNLGSHRRQFVTAPLRGLPPGSYELVLEVTDETNGRAARRSSRFTRI